MERSPEELIAIITEKFELVDNAGFQKSFLIHDLLEAKFAMDILVSHGFDCKLYTDDNHARLLVGTQPNITAKHSVASSAYAVSLKHIKHALDDLCKADGCSYVVSVSSPSPASKAISIQIQAPKSTIAASSAAFSGTPSSLPHTPSAPKPLPKKVVPKSGFQEFSSLLGGLFRAQGQGLFKFLLIGVIGLFLFVMLKGAICGDLAAYKNDAWYCKL